MWFSYTEGISVLNRETLQKENISIPNYYYLSLIHIFIKEDLAKAEGLLSDFTDRFYVSLSACDALHAKVCLSLKDYTNAAAYADKVITKSNFALSTTSVEYAQAFVSNSSSKELVFALANKRCLLYTSRCV